MLSGFFFGCFIPAVEHSTAYFCEQALSPPAAQDRSFRVGEYRFSSSKRKDTLGGGNLRFECVVRIITARVRLFLLTVRSREEEMPDLETRPTLLFGDGAEPLSRSIADDLWRSESRDQPARHCPEERHTCAPMRASAGFGFHLRAVLFSFFAAAHSTTIIYMMESARLSRPPPRMFSEEDSSLIMGLWCSLGLG